MYTVERGYEKRTGEIVVTATETCETLDEAIQFAKNNGHRIPHAVIKTRSKSFTMFLYYYANRAWNEARTDAEYILA